MNMLDLYRQARARVARQIAIIGAQAQRRGEARARERLRAEGLLPTEKELPTHLQKQAD